LEPFYFNRYSIGINPLDAKEGFSSFTDKYLEKMTIKILQSYKRRKERPFLAFQFDG
jgi:hypothetical protein